MIGSLGEYSIAEAAENERLGAVMGNEIEKDFDLNSVKASIVECVKVAGHSEDCLRDDDFKDWHNDFNQSWQLRFIHDLQCLQQSINSVNDALLQKELSTIDKALRGAVLNSSSLASTFESITSDLMRLRHVLKNPEVESKS